MKKAKHTSHTFSEVFIIESLSDQEKRAGLLEGKIVKAILKMGCKRPVYRFVKTREDLEDAAAEFRASRYRYLHLSCHGNKNGFEFSFGNISFPDFATIFGKTLKNRRLFVSACECVNMNLVRHLIPSSGCYSIIGPYETVDFDVAAVVWASYYYLAFRNDQTSMKRKRILGRLKRLTRLFRTNLSYYARSKSKGILRKRLIGRVKK